jgi:hypothetical protein
LVNYSVKSNAPNLATVQFSFSSKSIPKHCIVRGFTFKLLSSKIEWFCEFQLEITKYFLSYWEWKNALGVGMLENLCVCEVGKLNKVFLAHFSWRKTIAAF